MEEKEKIWCENCGCYVKGVNWSGDDRQHLLCPGCDDDLIDPVDEDEE
jgi:hypothetical protein